MPRIPNSRHESADRDPEIIPWGFHPNGAFDFDSDRRQLSPCSSFVRSLCLLRRHSNTSPKEMAARIAASPFPDILGAGVHSWLIGSDFSQWPFCLNSTAAASCITHAGIHPNAGSWSGGSFSRAPSP